MALKLGVVMARLSTLRNPFQYERYEVEDKEVIIQAAPGVKSLFFRIMIMGSTDVYSTQIIFYDVVFSEEEEIGYIPLEVEGKQLYFKPLSKNNRICVKCQCSDSRFMWEYPMFKVKSMIGAFRKYKRVPGSTRPPKNPKNIPGYCKHTQSILLYLRDKGYLV